MEHNADVLVFSGDNIYCRMLALELARRGLRLEQRTALLQDVAPPDLCGAVIADADFFDASLCADIFNALPLFIIGSKSNIEPFEEKLSGRGNEYFSHPIQIESLLTAVCALFKADAGGGEIHMRGKLPVDELRIKEREGRVFYRGEEISLTKREYELLSLLYYRRGRPLTRAEALSELWKGEDAQSNVVDVYIRYLREKIDERFGVKLITTVRGAGYRIITD